MTTIKAIGLAVTLLTISLAVTVANAQELPKPNRMILNKGIFCDTVEQVERLLTGISLNAGSFPEVPIKGCGSIKGSWNMLVTPTHWYTTPLAITLIASVVRADGYTQYAWVAFKPNPDYIPPVADSGI